MASIKRYKAMLKIRLHKNATFIAYASDLFVKIPNKFNLAKMSFDQFLTCYYFHKQNPANLVVFQFPN